MAKLRGGILGKVTGAVGNVVTASWKGINYARDRVIPANPRSIGQTRIRDNMRNLVLLGRSIKSTFIDTYWENLVRGTSNSGWAKFIGTAQKSTQALQDLENVKMSTGDLEPAAGSHIGLNTTLDVVEYDWNKSVFSNGSDTDVVYCYAFVPERNFVYSQSSSFTRNDGSATVFVPNIVSISGTIYAYMSLKKADGSLFSTTQGVKLVV